MKYRKILKNRELATYTFRSLFGKFYNMNYIVKVQ